MKVLFDHQIFDFQEFGGVSRYFFELLAHFEKDASVEWDLSILYSNNEYLKGLSSLGNTLLPRSGKVDHYKNFLSDLDFKGKSVLYRAKNKLWGKPRSPDESQINKQKSIEKIKEGDFDIFHPTYYDDYFLNYINDKPFVLTVYDLIHQIFPEFGLYETTDKNKELLQKASKIIAISHSTKRDLVNIFNINENKIEVIHLASSLREDGSAVSSEFIKKLPSNYLLYVGGRGGYKNFLFFSYIFSSLAQEEKDIAVICTGAPFNEGEKYLFNKAGITDRMYHTYVDDNELSYLYKNAIAFVFPSMYEGFGLPILEAFSCGCPVLVSNTSSLTEIAGDAAGYFEPKNPASMIAAIRQLIRDKDLRTDYVSKGYQQVKKFSWEKTAINTRNVYQHIIQERINR